MRPAVLPALLSLLAAAAAGTAAPPAGGESPVLSQGVRAAVQVTAMDLDVVATKDSQPVPDLRKEEFTVTVDGKAIPLDYFSRVDSGTLHGPDLATASPDLVLETLAGDAGDRYLARQFLVFFDDAHLLVFDRPRVLEGLRDLVTRLSPSDRMSIVVYNTAATVLVPFTASKEDLLVGISALEKKSPSGQSWDSQFRQEQNNLRRPCQYASVSQRARSACDAGIRSWSEQVRVREAAVLQEMRRAVSGLSARSGKRVFLYVSRGLELHPGQSFVQSMGPSLVNQYDYSVTEDFEAVVAEANRSGVTMHALDARGLAVEGADASEAEPSALNSFFTSQNRREALAGFAERTGGLHVENRNVFAGAIDRIYRESSTYYSVGVTLGALDPSRKTFSVKVSCTREGVTVKARRSYGVKSSDDAARDRMEMALLTPDARGDFDVELEIGPAEKKGGIGRRVSPFAIRIPVTGLTFAEKDGLRRADVEVSLAAVEDNGAKSTLGASRFSIDIPTGRWDEAVRQGFTYRGEMKSRTGNQRFVATVRDLGSDRVAIAARPVRIE